MAKKKSDKDEAAKPAKKAAAKKTASVRKSTGRKVMFSLEAPQAGMVSVVGTFNKWIPGKNLMKKNAYGVWTGTVILKPGRYEYKFLVDGDWIADPSCGEHVYNEYGTHNSVLTV